MLIALRFRSRNVLARALEHFVQFLRALLVQLDPSAMRGDFTLPLLRLGPAIGDLSIDLVQPLPFFRQRRFASVDPGTRLLFGLA